MDNRLGGASVCSDAARLGMRSQDQPLNTVRVVDQQIAWHRQETWHDYKTSATLIVCL